MAVDESDRSYEHPLYQHVERLPGVSVALGNLDQLLTWGSANSLWIFPMATSCCGIEFMAAAAGGVDLDRMGSIPRATPRQCDVMVVAGTITVKMAPRVKKLWEQMPEPKWCVAMGSCAISGDFYRDIYSVVPGIDTFIPVDVYVPGCPPNPEALMHGLLRLQEKIRMLREGKLTREQLRPERPANLNRPAIGRLQDPERDPLTDEEQMDSAGGLGLGGNLNLAGIRRRRPEPEPEPEVREEAGAADEGAP
jgi:NADH-quinone oxidoreductase subunit B